jgi:hypothetical protein
MKFSYILAAFALPACMANDMLKFQEALSELAQVTRDIIPAEVAKAEKLVAPMPTVCLKAFDTPGKVPRLGNAVCPASSLLYTDCQLIFTDIVELMTACALRMSVRQLCPTTAVYSAPRTCLAAPPLLHQSLRCLFNCSKRRLRKIGPVRSWH